MRAMVLGNIGDVAANPLVVQDVSVPEPGPGEVLVDVSVCGICRTDLHAICWPSLAQHNALEAIENRF